MDAKSLLLAFVLISPLTVAASDAKGELLLKGNAVAAQGEKLVATDGASVVGRSGEPRITADRIVFDQARGTLVFSGGVKISANGVTVEASEATLATEGRRVFVLSRGKVSLPESAAISSKDGARYMPLFTEPFPKIETALPKAR